MWPMILLMSRLPGGHSRSAGTHTKKRDRDRLQLTGLVECTFCLQDTTDTCGYTVITLRPRQS